MIAPILGGHAESETAKNTSKKEIIIEVAASDVAKETFVTSSDKNNKIIVE